MEEYSLRDEGIVVGKMGRGRRITVPQEICESLGFKESEFIGLKVTRSRLTVLPQSAVQEIVRARLQKQKRT